MSDRYGSPPPDDEPIIGASYPPPPRPAARGAYVGAPEPPLYEDEEPYPEGDFEDEYEYEYDDEYDDGYDDEFYEGTPARQPLFYLFIGLAAVVGGIIIFLLFSLVNTSDSTDNGTPAAAQFKVFLDSPPDGSRVETGKAEDVAVRATSTQPIARFELFVNDKSVQSMNATQSPTTNTYSATLQLPAFDHKGTYQVFVRVTTTTNEHADSAKINVVAIQPVGDKPLVVKGKVIATVNVRQGPGETYPLVKTLETGQDVNIIGKTKDSEWLLVDIDGGLWVKRAAIQEQDSLALVPIKDPTPVPLPTAASTNTPQPSPSASPSASPTANAKLPDFVPQTAQLTDGGTKLRVSINNSSANAYSGGLVVAVSGLGPGTLTSAFQVDIAAGGSATVSFDLNPAVTTQKSATIKVDPDNAVKEANKDNNSITVALTPPIEQPQLAVTVPTGTLTSLTVVVANTGGALTAPTATIRVRLGNQTTSLDVGLTIDKGKSQTVAGVPRPGGNGTATVEVVVNGVVLATTQIELQ